MAKKELSKTECPLDFAFRRIGGKYKGRIVWYIFENNNLLRFGELRKIIDQVTPKMLTQALRELEEDNLLKRTVYIELPPRVEYSLTETGKQLIPVVRNLRLWAIGQMHFFD